MGLHLLGVAKTPIHRDCGIVADVDADPVV